MQSAVTTLKVVTPFLDQGLTSPLGNKSVNASAIQTDVHTLFDARRDRARHRRPYRFTSRTYRPFNAHQFRPAFRYFAVICCASFAVISSSPRSLSDQSQRAKAPALPLPHAGSALLRQA